MFADDTKSWTKIETAEDSQTLQRDLDKLTEWSERWLLSFNPDKCKVMHIGHKLGTEYKMIDQGKDWILQEIEEEKDLGVNRTADL
jgi:hypothetical protein